MASRFRKKKHVSEDMYLNITPMADVFTILLVFLLKSYSTSIVNITPTQGLVLPELDKANPPSEALKVEISENAVSIEGKPVTSLESFQFQKSDIQKDGISQSLNQALEKDRKRQLLIAEQNQDVKVDQKVMVIADKRAPYSTIKRVLASAATQGYTDFKLVVIQNQ